jgi:hypothetical protein
MASEACAIQRVGQVTAWGGPRERPRRVYVIGAERSVGKLQVFHTMLERYAGVHQVHHVTAVGSGLVEGKGSGRSRNGERGVGGEGSVETEMLAMDDTRRVADLVFRDILARFGDKECAGVG